MSADLIQADAKLLTREQWLAARRNSIGASDCPAVMGQSPYRTPLQVYADKLGLLPDEPETPQQRRGNRLEPLVLEDYADHVGYAIEQRQVFVRHPRKPWMTATLDAVRPDGRPVEVKTVGAFRARDWGEEGTDEVPGHVLLQVHHQLIVTEQPVADIAVLIGGETFRVHTVKADPEIAAMILAKEEAFWSCVSREIPPPPCGEDHQVLRLLYPEPNGYQVWDEEWALAVQMWEALGRQIASEEEQRKFLKTTLLARLGDAEAAELPDGRRLKRSIVETKEHTVKAFISQRISVTHPKAK